MHIFLEFKLRLLKFELNSNFVYVLELRQVSAVAGKVQINHISVTEANYVIQSFTFLGTRPNLE